MRYENQSFEDETLVLDGNEYINCTFANCTLVYSALPGESGKIEPFIGTDVQVRYEGAAKVAIGLHDKIIAAGANMAPIGGFLRIGTAWFQRVPKPSNAGSEGEKTEGMGVVAFR